jgi:hypothetical protein
MRARALISLIETILYKGELLDEIVVFDPEAEKAHRIDEGRWIPTKTSNTMRIDRPTHSVGQTHAHIYGRKGNEVGVVNLDGTASHDTRMRLSQKDADTLRAHGFTIRRDRIVEWIVRPELTRALLLG